MRILTPILFAEQRTSMSTVTTESAEMDFSLGANIALMINRVAMHLQPASQGTAGTTARVLHVLDRDNDNLLLPDYEADGVTVRSSVLALQRAAISNVEVTAVGERDAVFQVPPVILDWYRADPSERPVTTVNLRHNSQIVSVAVTLHTVVRIEYQLVELNNDELVRVVAGRL